MVLTRLAEERVLKDFVVKWRKEHTDWKILANFILYKNTSRHFKRSDSKRKLTQANLLAEHQLLCKRLKDKQVDMAAVDVNEPIIERTSKRGRKEQPRDKSDQGNGEMALRFM